MTYFSNQKRQILELNTYRFLRNMSFLTFS